MALVQAKLVEAIEGPTVDGSAIWRFTKEALTRFITRWQPKCRVGSPVEEMDDAVWFEQALRVVSGAGVRLARLLVDVEGGKVAAGWDHTKPGLRGLWFEALDLEAYAKSVRREARQGRLTSREVCQLLQCKITTLYRLYDAGLLVPVGGDTGQPLKPLVYDARAVNAFQESYITTDEASTLLGVTRLTVQTWARAGRIQALTGPAIDGSHVYRFDREALTRWRSERMTFGEAQRALQISKASLHRWVQEGKLVPLNDMGGQQRWFAQSDIESLAREYYP